MVKEIEDLKAIQKKHATECFWDGEDHELILPPGFGEKKRADNKRKAASVDPQKFKEQALKDFQAKQKKDEEEAEKQKKIDEEAADKKSKGKAKEANKGQE